MEELGALVLVALAGAIALGFADLAGWLMGRGWGHYSKKARAKRSKAISNE